MNDENKPKAIVPVVGEGLKNGFRKEDVPDGFITWDEHWEAWFAFHDAYPRGDTAEQTANGGGFTFNELKQWLGHTPKSWIPRDMTKFKSYFDDMYNPAQDDEPVVEVAPEIQLSHIWYVDGESICKAAADVPTTPFNFDVVDGPSCELCLDKLLGWLRDWANPEE